MIVISHFKGKKTLGPHPADQHGEATKRFVLNPGINRDVPDLIWRRFNELPTIKAEIKQGLLEASESDPDDLLGSDDSGAKAHIIDQENPKVLAKWLKAEQRPKIRALIEDRIIEVGGQPPPRLEVPKPEKPPKEEKPEKPPKEEKPVKS